MLNMNVGTPGAATDSPYPLRPGAGAGNWVPDSHSAGRFRLLKL